MFVRLAALAMLVPHAIWLVQRLTEHSVALGEVAPLAVSLAFFVYFFIRPDFVANLNRKSLFIAALLIVFVHARAIDRNNIADIPIYEPIAALVASRFLIPVLLGCYRKFVATLAAVFGQLPIVFTTRRVNHEVFPLPRIQFLRLHQKRGPPLCA
jgi:hypothetical protein